MKLLLPIIVAALLGGTAISSAQDTPPPVRVGIVGLVHAHVHGILAQSRQLEDIEIVGIAEPNRDLALRYLAQHGLDEKLWFKEIPVMLDESQPEAVAVFTSTFDHKAVVDVCAPRGIHVMMEKPLAVSLAHASTMAAVAKAHGVHLLVNYETTWYRSKHAARALVQQKNGGIGALRKIVVHDGHPGPIEIGCNAEFLDWLTDPVRNGGGALTDFGCYGANLITWLMQNERPLTVSAMTQQIKPDKYPNVDDEATILLSYPRAQGIIQASWNWPFSRKDMEVYGTAGYVHTVQEHSIRLKDSDAPERLVRAPALPEPQRNPFAYLAAVVRKEIEPDGLTGLANNLIVTEILDAARESARTGTVVTLRPRP